MPGAAWAHADEVEPRQHEVETLRYDIHLRHCALVTDHHLVVTFSMGEFPC